MRSCIAAWFAIIIGCFLAGCGAPKSTETRTEEKQDSKKDDAKRTAAKETKTDPGKQAKADAAEFEGTWTIVSSKVNGIEFRDEKGVNISFAGDKMTYHGDKPQSVTIKFDPTKRPREINVMIPEPDVPSGIPGIYEINGDTLKIATGHYQATTDPPSKKGEEPKKKTIISPRPKNFDDDKGADVMVLKRSDVPIRVAAPLSTEQIKKLILGKWHVAKSGSPILGDVEFTPDGKIIRTLNQLKPEEIGSYSIKGRTLACSVRDRGEQYKYEIEIYDVSDTELKTGQFKGTRIK